MINFTIEGVPVPQLRPRATRFGKGIRMYDPKKVKDYKDYVSMTARQHAPKELMTDALKMELDIYRPIPKSTSKRRRKLKNGKRIRPIVKPDIDNYSKAILDSLNGIIYKDDSQIVELNIKKFYSDQPRVEVRVGVIQWQNHDG